MDLTVNLTVEVGKVLTFFPVSSVKFSKISYLLCKHYSLFSLLQIGLLSANLCLQIVSDILYHFRTDSQSIYTTF